MTSVTVHLGKRSYPIVIGTHLVPKTGGFIRKFARLTHSSAVILTTSVLRRLLGNTVKASLRRAGVTPFFIEIPDTEKSKSISEYSKVIHQLTQISKGGNTFFLINLGGGVVGDLGGFIAATFKRGIPYIQLPSTLLAQVDSAIGGKTGIDLPEAKNMVGALWQPSLVISDVAVLETLPQREFISGLGEVIKYGVIKGGELFRFLERSPFKQLQVTPKVLINLVTACSRCKARFVEEDERDQNGQRAVLNFGHTIGHAIESATGYSNLYKHGEAISIGMVCATRISIALGLADHKLLKRLTCLLQKVGLPIYLDKRIPSQKVLNNFLFDKKFLNSQNRFVLPVKIGQVILQEKIPLSMIQEALQACRL